jgi:Na+-translocating ferredoxin:NAD+ oxidoreductase RnfD subunit
MVLETRKRREHLSNDDLMKNKALLENFAKGNAQYLEQQQQTQNGENGEVSDQNSNLAKLIAQVCGKFKKIREWQFLLTFNTTLMLIH